MNRFICTPIEAQYIVRQLTEDRVTFQVAYTKMPKSLGEPQDPDNKVVIETNLNCKERPEDCKECHLVKVRAMNYLRYMLDEAPYRQAPHNSTDDYD